MGRKFGRWIARDTTVPQSVSALVSILLRNRQFQPLEKLNYGDHGLHEAAQKIQNCIEKNRRIALYADYDVDGTMCCVSWIWFFEAIGFQNYSHYIPCRFKEGYGVNLKAIQYLIEERKAELIITMDTGITANEEAAYCRSRGVDFICTDHHKIQLEKMPDCTILNPKLHPHAHYQELCGSGITFVLLRRLAQNYCVSQELWTDLLALAGMATICDVVSLNPVNHKLARLGVSALGRSQRPVLKRLRESAALWGELDESDVGFRLGPRINAVGRLGHADKVIEAFISGAPDPLIKHMESLNKDRKKIQEMIIREARNLAESSQEPILFLGGDWHPGVVGIAASRVAEDFWKPTFLFQRKDNLCKGSARSIPGFDVTEAMRQASSFFVKFGGHSAAGGFTFLPENEERLREIIGGWGAQMKEQLPTLWEPKISYDCELPFGLASLTLLDALDGLRPYGLGFDEPTFLVRGRVTERSFYLDKTTSNKKHTAFLVQQNGTKRHKILFFNDVLEDMQGSESQFLVKLSRNHYRGVVEVSMIGKDITEQDSRMTIPRET